MQLCNESDESAQKSMPICEKSPKPSALSFADFVANVSTYYNSEEPKKLVSKSVNLTGKRATPLNSHRNIPSKPLNGHLQSESSLLNFLSNPSKERKTRHSARVKVEGNGSPSVGITTHILDPQELSDLPPSVLPVTGDIRFHSTRLSLSVTEIESALDTIAAEYPTFPARYCYSVLKNRLYADSSEDDANRQGNILWSEKYAPMKLSHLVSNGTGGLKLRRWLNRWQSHWKSSVPPASSRPCGNLPRKTRNMPDAAGSDDEFRSQPNWRNKRRKTTTSVGHAQEFSLHLGSSRADETLLPVPSDSQTFLEPLGHRDPAASHYDDQSNDESDVSAEAAADSEEDDEGEGAEPDHRGDWRSRAYLIVGPHGCGKTAMVYALAQELGFKVFEMNASNRRSGRDIASQFQVALDSQHVAKENLSTSFSTFHMTNCVKVSSGKGISSKRSSFFVPRQSKSSSGRSTNCRAKNLQQTDQTPKGLNLSSNSLVLFDEVDVLFPSDRGFWSGLSNLLNLARRPILLTASDPTVAQNLPFPVRIIRVHSPPLALLAPYLRVIALVEGSVVDKPSMEAFVVSAHHHHHHHHHHHTGSGSVSHPIGSLDLRALLNRLHWTLTSPMSANETTASSSLASVQQMTVDEQKLSRLLDSSFLDHLARLHPTLFSLSGPQRSGKTRPPCPNGQEQEQEQEEVDIASATAAAGDAAAGDLSAVFAEEDDDEQGTPTPGTLPMSADSVASSPISVNMASARAHADPPLPAPAFLTDVLEELARICSHASHFDSTRSGLDRACSSYILEHCVEENVCLAAGEFTTSVNPSMTGSCCPSALGPFDDQLGDQGQLFSETWPTLLQGVCRSRLSTLEAVCSRLQSEEDLSSPVFSTSCNNTSTTATTTTTTTTTTMQTCRFLTNTTTHNNNNNNKQTRIWSDVLRCGSPSSGAALSSTLATNLAQESSGCSSRLAVANRKALICDYLPQLRTLAAGETARQAVSTKRRFLHYFDRISLYLKPSTRKLLAETVFSSEATAS